MLPDAMSPPAPADLQCEECPERASFIQHGRALCHNHAHLPPGGWWGHVLKHQRLSQGGN